jgi:hypothetical protein
VAPPPEEAVEEEAKSDSSGARVVLNPFIKQQLSSKAVEAKMVMARLSDGAQTYFISEQRYREPGDDVFWHERGDDATTRAGMPVAWADYVFPGGASFSMITHESVPKGGEKAALDVSDPKVAKFLRSIYLELDGATYFRYTYTTGPGKGDEATATIKAEADFDPSTPEVHTVVYELRVDASTQEVVVSGPTTTHMFH